MSNTYLQSHDDVIRKVIKLQKSHLSSFSIISFAPDRAGFILGKFHVN